MRISTVWVEPFCQNRGSGAKVIVDGVGAGVGACVARGGVGRGVGGARRTGAGVGTSPALAMVK